MSIQNYNLLKPGRFVDILSSRKRLEMYNLFLKTFSPTEKDLILDVGVTADKYALSSNFFEKYYPHKQNIIALSNQDARFLTEEYPGLSFKQGDALNLPFNDNSIDFVFSAAVIEHVGSNNRQQQMLTECYRVARKGIFITTPNRWHPVEVHTLLPLLHWLPKKLHRRLLRLVGLNFYAQEENLNLLDKKQFNHFCQSLQIQQPKILQIKTFGFTSNLILVANKYTERP